MAEIFDEMGLPYTIVATKVDKCKQVERELSFARLRESFELPEGLPMAFSSATGEGKRELWSLLVVAAVEDYDS